MKARMAVGPPLGIAVYGALLFVPAGTLRYWQAWMYLGAWLVLMPAAWFYFYKHDPELLRRRMAFKEKVREQKWIMGLVYGLWPMAMLLPGLDHRYGWSHLPVWLAVVAEALVLGGLLVAFGVLKANRFAGRTIEVQPGQTLVSDGLYGVVRHPMYLGMCVVFLFTPLALGSYWALPAFALLLPIIGLRLLNEEKVLQEELAGYREYCKRTRYRLVPGVW